MLPYNQKVTITYFNGEEEVHDKVYAGITAIGFAISFLDKGVEKQIIIHPQSVRKLVVEKKE